jgi:carboxypeptidase Q
MKTLLPLLLLLFQSSDSVTEKIVSEGRENSQVMDHLDHLVNKIGPRLTSSTNLTKACEWARDRFKSWGLNAWLEEWGSFPVGFDRGPWSAKMVEPEEKALTIGSPSWSPGTKGPVTGPAVLAPSTDDELAAVKEKLGGAWVISTGKAAEKYLVAYEDAGAAGVIRSSGSEFIHT